MDKIYQILGLALFWGLSIIVAVILLSFFWEWNVKRSTIIFQVYDYLKVNYQYSSWDNEKKSFMYNSLKSCDHLKNRIGYKSILRRLKEDVHQ